jgi:hypothetical protein
MRGVVVAGSNSVTVDYPGAFYTFLYGINNWGTVVGVHYDGRRLSGHVTLHQTDSKVVHPMA